MRAIQKAAVAALMSGRGGMIPTTAEQAAAEATMKNTGLTAGESLIVASANKPLSATQKLIMADIMLEIERDFDRE